MKKILTLIVFAAGLTTGYAQGQQNPQWGSGPQVRSDYPPQKGNYGQYGSLVVTFARQKQFEVYIDNQQYQNNGNNGSGDNNGSGNNVYGNTVNIRQLNAGNHIISIYQWKTNFWGKQVRQELYNSSLFVKAGFQTTIFINDAGQVNISEQQVYNSDQGGYCNNGNGVGYGYGRKKNKHKNKHHCKDDDDDDRKYDRKKDKKEKNYRDDD